MGSLRELAHVKMARVVNVARVSIPFPAWRVRRVRGRGAGRARRRGELARFAPLGWLSAVRSANVGHRLPDSGRIALGKHPRRSTIRVLLLRFALDLGYLVPDRVLEHHLRNDRGHMHAHGGRVCG